MILHLAWKANTVTEDVDNYISPQIYLLYYLDYIFYQLLDFDSRNYLYL